MPYYANEAINWMKTFYSLSNHGKTLLFVNMVTNWTKFTDDLIACVWLNLSYCKISNKSAPNHKT